MTETKTPTHNLFNMDAVEFLETLENESIDLILCDPPYQSLEKWRKMGTTTRLKQSKSSSNRWFEIFPNERFDELFGEFWRVLKKNSHLYVFSDFETSKHLIQAGEDQAFKFWKPLIFDKMLIGMGYHYRATYEFILFFEKGKRKLNNLGVSDILRAKRIHRGFPAEKPPELSEVLISQSTEEGQVVCDPFCGSGTTGMAALKLGRRFLGNDLDEEMVLVSQISLREALSGDIDNIRKSLRKKLK